MNNRNHKCACGSGLKTKRCCGNEAERARKYQEAWNAPQPPPETRQDATDTTAKHRPRLSTIMCIAAAMLGGHR